MDRSYRTSRLILEVLKPEDHEIVLDYYIRNKDFLKLWEPQREDSYFSKSKMMKLLYEDNKKINEGSSLRLWIFKEDEYKHRTIGSVCINNIIRGVFQSGFLGYKLDKDETGNGYMREALKKGIEVVFNELKLHRLEANIIPRNTASIKVIKSLGFYEEGLAKNYLYINGSWEDHYHYVLINDGFIFEKSAI